MKRKNFLNVYAESFESRTQIFEVTEKKVSTGVYIFFVRIVMWLSRWLVNEQNQFGVDFDGRQESDMLQISVKVWVGRGINPVRPGLHMIVVLQVKNMELLGWWYQRFCCITFKEKSEIIINFSFSHYLSFSTLNNWPHTFYHISLNFRKNNES